MKFQKVPDDTHEGSVEIVAPGNDVDEDDNWKLEIEDGKLKAKKRVGGVWVFAGGFAVR